MPPPPHVEAGVTGAAHLGESYLPPHWDARHGCGRGDGRPGRAARQRGLPAAVAPPHGPQRLYEGLVGRATLARSDMVIMREEFVEVVAENQRLLRAGRKGQAAGRGIRQDRRTGGQAGGGARGAPAEIEAGGRLRLRDRRARRKNQEAVGWQGPGMVLLREHGKVPRRHRRRRGHREEG